MDTKILFENGTSELEVLVFTLGNETCGINVAEIKEIITYQPVTPVPNSHPGIEGVFMPRDTMITAIDLKNYMGWGRADRNGLLIVTNSHILDVAFHVDAVLGIYRASRMDIIKPDVSISIPFAGVTAGIIKIENKMINMLDFEKIISDICPETALKIPKESGTRNRSDVPVLIAEDSPLLNKLIVDFLRQSGYENLIITKNGKEAYEVICQCKKNGTLHDHVSCIITDIEMPLMDGHRLTKLVKSDKAAADIPVVIFSSLITEEMKKKGEALGADAQLSKPEIGNLVKIIDGLTVEKYLEN